MAKFLHPNGCGGIPKPLPSFGRPRRLIWLVCEYFTDFFPLCSTHKSHNYTHHHSGADGPWQEVQPTPSIEPKRDHGTALPTGCPMVRPDEQCRCSPLAARRPAQHTHQGDTHTHTQARAVAPATHASRCGASTHARSSLLTATCCTQRLPLLWTAATNTLCYRINYENVIYEERKPKLVSLQLLYSCKIKFKYDLLFCYP